MIRSSRADRVEVVLSLRCITSIWCFPRDGGWDYRCTRYHFLSCGLGVLGRIPVSRSACGRNKKRRARYFIENGLAAYVLICCSRSSLLILCNRFVCVERASRL